MTYLFIFIATLMGFAVGYFLGNKRSKKFIAANDWKAQQLLYMYMASDEMYRARFNKWAQTHQAMMYVELISDSLGGSLYLLPVEDKKQMQELMESLRS